MERLKKRRDEIVERFPNLEYQLNELMELCEDEIEQGASPDNEVALALNEFESLFQEGLVQEANEVYDDDDE